MLDLKAKLAAAGVVTQKQVEDFDSKQAQSLAEAAQKKSQPRANHVKSPARNQGQGAKARPAKARSDYDFEALKKLNKGEAYDRLRKLVARTRLDDGERTIPGPDDHAFSFVTAKGRIGRLYLKDETSRALKEGSAAISTFISHHGQAHCVLPKDIALGIARVFPLWLRHLRDHPAAGLIEEAEPQPVAESAPQ